jgi:hypothetical protein
VLVPSVLNCPAFSAVRDGGTRELDVLPGPSDEKRQSSVSVVGKSRQSDGETLLFSFPLPPCLSYKHYWSKKVQLGSKGSKESTSAENPETRNKRFHLRSSLHLPCSPVPSPLRSSVLNLPHLLPYALALSPSFRFFLLSSFAYSQKSLETPRSSSRVFANGHQTMSTFFAAQASRRL